MYVLLTGSSDWARRYCPPCLTQTTHCQNPHSMRSHPTHARPHTSHVRSKPKLHPNALVGPAAIAGRQRAHQQRGHQGQVLPHSVEHLESRRFAGVGGQRRHQLPHARGVRCLVGRHRHVQASVVGRLGVQHSPRAPGAGRLALVAAVRCTRGPQQGEAPALTPSLAVCVCVCKHCMIPTLRVNSVLFLLSNHMDINNF